MTGDELGGASRGGGATDGLSLSVPEADRAESSPAQPAPARPASVPWLAWWRAWRELPMVVPPVAWGVLAWHRRWISDDGLIVARTVREILAGNGPVFNPGERVEADTSVLWTWLLAGFTWASRLDIYMVFLWAGLLLAPLGLLLALLGARELHQRYAPGRPLLPVGAAVVLALPPFWDFATSGLEDSLVFCWLGLCWWLLAGLRPDSRRRASWLAFVAGLGWLVRPDMAIGTVTFLAAGWYVMRPDWRRCVVLGVIAGALPVAYQVFRMGYYGLLVPNTAVAKAASSAHVGRGLAYLANFISPYQLWLPLLALVGLFLLTAGWRLDRADAVRVAAPVAAGVLGAAYVVAIGGDFMHARMLLPPTFALLLPVMVVPMPRLSRQALSGRVFSSHVATAAVCGLCVVAIGAWAVACGVALRDPRGLSKTGVGDERAYWVARVHQEHPVTAAQYVQALLGQVGAAGSKEAAISRDANSGTRVLLYSITPGAPQVAVPLSRPGYSVATAQYWLGTGGAGTPLDGLVVDQRGLSYVLGSHEAGKADARPGHAIWVYPVWIVAEYSNVTTAPGISAGQLAAARKALSCGALAGLDQATQAPLTFGRFMSNVTHSLSMSTFHFSPDPVTAEHELCG